MTECAMEVMNTGLEIKELESSVVRQCCILLQTEIYLRFKLELSIQFTHFKEKMPRTRTHGCGNTKFCQQGQIRFEILPMMEVQEYVEIKQQH